MHGDGRRAGDPRRWGRWGRLALAAALALPLAGCMKMDIGVTIRSDDAIDLAVSIGVQDSMASMVSPSGDLCADMTGQSGSPITLPGLPSMQTKDVDGYLTCDITATVSLNDISGSASGFSITREADTYHFHLDSLAGDTSGSLELTTAMISSFRVAVTFPGDVVSHSGSGTVAGRTVTWTSAADALSPDGLDAVGRAGAGGGTMTIIIAAVISALAAIAIAVLVFWLVKSRKRQPDPAAGYPAYAVYGQGGPVPPGPYGPVPQGPNGPAPQGSYPPAPSGTTPYAPTAYGQPPYGQTPYGQAPYDPGADPLAPTTGPAGYGPGTPVPQPLDNPWPYAEGHRGTP